MFLKDFYYGTKEGLNKFFSTTEILSTEQKFIVSTHIYKLKQLLLRRHFLHHPSSPSKYLLNK